jgi:hypothetical protein
MFVNFPLAKEIQWLNSDPGEKERTPSNGTSKK